MNGQETSTIPEESPWGPLASTGFAKLALLVGALYWVFIVNSLWDNPETVDSLLRAKIFFLPPLVWAVLLIVLLLRKGDLVDAICILLLTPLTLVANWIFELLASHLLTGAMWPQDGVLELATMLLCLAWAAFAWQCYRALMHAKGEEPDDLTLTRLLKAIDLIKTLLVILAIALIGLYAVTPPPNGYSIRSRVSELILAGSSAKTALSEGMQTYGSWSSEWMSSITISATGMVESASIGPTGQIIVYGVKAASYATVTLTPTVTMDDKLVWSCVGTPAKYMPASCRP